ncbi:MAG: HNH endonuclease signature motif containing protein [Syntrophales bacterium]
MNGEKTVLTMLIKNNRAELEQRLYDRQSGKCFICDDPIDLVLHHGQLDIDHIIPLDKGGPDEENNFALTHSSCNRSKGTADLHLARRMAQFDRLQKHAQESGARGANLGHVLKKYGGAKAQLILKRKDKNIEYSLPEVKDVLIYSCPLYKDSLCAMDYFFTVLPIEYLHHDDRINPRSIGSNIRALIEEFMKGRPQLHVSLAWWAPVDGVSGPVKIFDGQHKAAAQILLGVSKLPVRIFVEPDTNVLLQANTNAGDKLRQIAFDTAVLRHLGSSLYVERVKQYQQMKGLREDNYSFSEKDLVTFFRGEHRELVRYIVDSARDSITHNQDNKLMEFVEWSGKSADRPLSYSTVERTFFKEFIFKKSLENSIDEGLERGDNPRLLERDQNVRLMSLFAEIFFTKKWEPEIGGRRLESRLQAGEQIPEEHLRAWRVAREEILGNILAWVRLVIENYFAWTGQMVDKERILQHPFPEDLWTRIESFLNNLSRLPCWIDKNLSTTVFGAKQNFDFWAQIFTGGKAPNGVRVLTEPLDINKMIIKK